MVIDRNLRAAALLICAGSAVLPLTGCPGSLDDPERFLQASCGGPGQPTCTSTNGPMLEPIQTDVLIPRCGFSGCHVQPNAQGDLDLASGGLRARVQSMTSSTALCRGQKMVVTGDPDASLLYNKLSGTPRCGVIMPLTGGIPQSEKDRIRLWIQTLPPR